MMAKVRKHCDAEFKSFVALGQKIAKRMRRSGVEMTFHINFGPIKKGSQGKTVSQEGK